MTRVFIETDDSWTIGRISSAINAEVLLLKRSLAKTQKKIHQFENKYGNLADRSSLYGKVDDMELIEWEGEIETLKRLEEKLKSLKEITFEYK